MLCASVGCLDEGYCDDDVEVDNDLNHCNGFRWTLLRPL